MVCREWLVPQQGEKGWFANARSSMYDVFAHQVLLSQMSV
ncbi:hypothetical protein ABIE13_000369 [Ottowia thiooxydans]|uniref:Uncharacterized protein n=1 Tax=Ottowia thiooxydans TaxID=219182 RepID=A0ABV2Q2W7_9BURK